MWKLGVAMLALSAATSASSPISDLAGRYDRSWANPQYGNDGSLLSNDRVNDVVEIVPISTSAAYFRVDLPDALENSCGLSGIAKLKGQSLVYHDPSPPLAGEAQCTLTISHIGDSLRVDDGISLGHGCSHRYCGMRGSLVNKRVPWSSKRPITYMSRLKASAEYRDALNERR